jgi:hypothetical protein
MEKPTDEREAPRRRIELLKVRRLHCLTAVALSSSAARPRRPCRTWCRPNSFTRRSPGYLSTLTITSCRQPKHATSSDLTPFWRMFARSIGAIMYLDGSAIGYHSVSCARIMAGLSSRSRRPGIVWPPPHRRDLQRRSFPRTDPATHCSPTWPLQCIRPTAAVCYLQRDVFIKRSALDWIPAVVY